MKVLAAIFLLASATASFAADRALYDLQYLPLAGTNYGITQLGITKGSAEAELVDVDVDYSGWDVSQELGHSFSDNFLLSAKMNFTHQDVAFENDGAYSVKGLSDPYITGRYRAMDEAFRLDFISTLGLGIADSKEDDSEYNNTQGGHQLSVGVEAGQKTEKFQYAGSLVINREFEAEHDPEVGSDITDDAHNSYTLGVAGLLKVAETSFVKGSVKAIFEDSYEDDENSSRGSQTIYNTGAEYQHLCSQNFLMRLGVNWQNIHTADFLEKVNIFTFIAGANYQF
jgi:hypothetical protein